MNRFLLAMALAALAGTALAQNFGAPRGDYARSIGESYQSEPRCRALDCVYPGDPVRSGNPMIQVCPDGWGYGPTRSGEIPKCVASEDDKNARDGLK